MITSGSWVRDEDNAPEFVADNQAAMAGSLIFPSPHLGSPYLTGVPPIRRLRPAHPDPVGCTYGALAAAPLLATVRDPLQRGSLLACRAAQPENRGPACRCRHSRAGFPHPPLARREQARRPVSNRLSYSRALR